MPEPSPDAFAALSRSRPHDRQPAASGEASGEPSGEPLTLQEAEAAMLSNLTELGYEV